MYICACTCVHDMCAYTYVLVRVCEHIYVLECLCVTAEASGLSGLARSLSCDIFM